nr:capsule assembly Wzi family protein [Bacteroidales bacterium]
MNEFLLSLLLTGALSTGPTLPFWMTANQFGLMPEHSGALALVQAGTQYDPTKDFQWKWGASLAANLDKGPTADFNLMVDELYASLKWRALSLDLGMRHDPLDFYGAAATLGSLSTTGGHLIASGNARSMPGYMLRLDSVPVPFTGKHVWLYGAFGDFKTLDKRYVQGALVHRTQLFVKVSVSRLDFDFGIDHYAIWAGQNPKADMPVTFENYLRVITARHASASGTWSDRHNVIGDQGGGELFRLSWRGDGWRTVLQHDIPYSDGSGLAFQNFPDGVNTLGFSFDRKDRWVSDVVYEFQYTRWQSGPFNP